MACFPKCSLLSLVRPNSTVNHLDYAVASLGDARIVSDHEKRRSALATEPPHEIEDVVRRFGV